MLETIVAYVIVGVWVGIVAGITIKVFSMIVNSIRRSNKYSNNILTLDKVGHNNGMPFVKAKIEGEEVYFLVDSASDVNFLDPNIIPILPDGSVRPPEVEEAHDSVLYGVSGAVSTIPCVINMEICGDKLNDVKFVIPESANELREVTDFTHEKIPLAGVLGHEFLENYRWELDFNKGLVRHNGKA